MLIVKLGANGMAEDGKIPLMALDDVGVFVKWIFDNPEQSAGMNLEMATDQVSFSDITSTFTRVTGRNAVHRVISFEEYLPKREPYPNAPANWAGNPRDEATMTWRRTSRPGGSSGPVAEVPLEIWSCWIRYIQGG